MMRHLFAQPCDKWDTKACVFEKKRKERKKWKFHRLPFLIFLSLPSFLHCYKAISHKLVLFFNRVLFHTWLAVQRGGVHFITGSDWEGALVRIYRQMHDSTKRQTRQSLWQRFMARARTFTHTRPKTDTNCCDINTHVHELHVGFRTGGLIEDFNSHGDLHRLTFWDPDALKYTSNHHKCTQ